MEITTSRLILRSVTPEQAQGMWDGVDLENVAPDLHPVPGYPGERSGMAFGYVMTGMGRTNEEGRGMFWIIRAEDHTVIGDFSFFTPPENPKTMITSMEIAASERGRGFGPESFLVLVELAIEFHDVECVRAESCRTTTHRRRWQPLPG